MFRNFLIVRSSLILILHVAAFASAIGQSKVIRTYAGPSLPISGSPAITQAIAPAALASDLAGGLYVASGAQNQVYRIGRDGILTVLAGTSSYGFSGDNGSAVAGRLAKPSGVVADAQGNVFIADTDNQRIRKVTPDGIIRTIAGTGMGGFSGDNGQALAAQFNGPAGLALDAANNLYVADQGNNRVRRISPDGIIRTVANVGSPGNLTIDGDGNLYIAGGPVYTVTADGATSTIVPQAHLGLFGSCLAPEFPSSLVAPYVCSSSAVAIDPAGVLYVVDSELGRLRKVTPDRLMTTVGFDVLSRPLTVTIDNEDNLYLADSERIRRIESNGTSTVIAGAPTRDFAGDGGPATSARLRWPSSVAADTLGNLYIADRDNHRIRKVSPEGLILTIAGNGSPGFSGDGGPAISAQLNRPSGIAVDAVGNVYISDSSNSRIRKVSPDGVIVTVAGIGVCCVSVAGVIDLGDGGPAALAQLNQPMGLVTDAAGNLYIADTANSRIRKVSPNGIITTVAGTGTAGFSGDGGPATSARLDHPIDVDLDSTGSLYISDSGNNRVRKVTRDGVITTVGTPDVRRLMGIAVDSVGNLYIADGSNVRIRRLSPDGSIVTIAGNGICGFAGDGGEATAAQFCEPSDVAVDTAGNIYIADSSNNRIRKVLIENGPQQPYVLASNGAIFLRTQDAADLKTGYARVRSTSGGVPMAGFAVFSLRQNGVLVSEASVPASEPVLSGRIYAELGTFVRTGLAFTNPSSATISISFFFTDDQGRDFGSGTLQIDPNAHIARFLDEAPFNLTNTSARTFTFMSSAPVSVIALRGLTNERSEFLVTTLPVAPLFAASTGELGFPHYAEGGGWSTQLILVNPTDQVMTGVTGFDTPYTIAPRSAYRFALNGGADTVHSGAVRVLPNGPAPSGLLIFSYRPNGITITEASVPASRIGPAFRMYAEPQTGLAITNLGFGTTTVTLELRTFAGEIVGTATVSLAASTHLAMFLKEFSQFASLPPSFQGVLRVTGTSISMIGLRTQYNERGDFLITTTPAVSESDPSPSELVFPHVVQGAGYTTEVVMFSTLPGSSSGFVDFTWQ